MELQKVKKLIKKYEAAETSLAEEKELREYFTKEEVPEHLGHYKALFNYTTRARNFSFEKQERGASAKKLYVWGAVAASIVLVTGLFFYKENPLNQGQGELGTLQEREIALEKSRETLQMVSEIMNEGRKDLQYLKEFNITTNKFIKEKE